MKMLRPMSGVRETGVDGARMWAIVQDGYGSPEQVLGLEEIDRPSPVGDEVLIRVRATSVNTPDWITVTGVPYVLRLKFGLRQPPTVVRGTDVAGIVEEVGPDVTDLRADDQVFGSAWNDSLASKGTFSQFAVAPAGQIQKKPEWLRFDEAAAAVMSGITALSAIRDVGRVKEGDRVLINGASGGVGTFAVQIAKALGATVTGVCGTGDIGLVRSLGADHAIDYTTDDFTRKPERYDVILDNVVNRRPASVARLLSPGGVFIPNSVGNSGRLFAGLPRMALAMIMGLGPLTVRAAKCVVNRENLDSLLSFLEGRMVKTVIDDVYSLDNAPAAVARMLSHHARGNVAIAVGQESA